MRRVNVAGNTRTRDEVIRREFRQFESSWYDGRKIKLSRDRVDRLGYFTDVNVDTAEVPGSADQVDLTVDVTEKPTGNLSLGAGFSSADKLSLTASIKQDNVFGSGNYLGVEVNTSKYNRTLVAEHGRSVLHDRRHLAHDRPLLPHAAGRSTARARSYELVTPGAALRFGVPFSEYDTVFFGVGAERTEIKGATALPNSYFLYRAAVRRNQRLDPADRRLVARQPRQRAGADGRPLRARQRRLRAVGDATVPARQRAGPAVRSVHAAFTFGLNAEIGYGKGLGGRPYPIFKNFYGGGLGSVRGFEQGSLGPLDVTGAFIGGNRGSTSTTSSTCRCPGANDDRTLRLFALHRRRQRLGRKREADAWTACAPRPASGVSWISPIGPLKLSYGAPDPQTARTIESSAFNSRSGPHSDEPPLLEIAARGDAPGGRGGGAGAGAEDRLRQQRSRACAKPMPAKAAQAKLEAEFSKREKDLNELAIALKTATDKLDKEAPTLTETERTRRQRELVDQDRDLQRRRASSRKT